MERFLARLAERVATRRRVVVGVWVVVLLVAAPLAARQTSRLSGGGWDVPGSTSKRSIGLLARFPGRTGDPVVVFVEGRDAASADKAAARARARVARFGLLRPGGAAQSLAGGKAMVLPYRYVGRRGDVYDYVTRVRTAVVSDAGGARTRVVGEAAAWSNFQSVAKQQLAQAETFGFPVILLILLAAFATALAATMPLLLGFVAVLVAGAAIYLLSGPFEISIYVTNMASMIGIGVAVDYSLFVVSRYRRALADGEEPRRALRDALASAGTAVVYSGATVVVSLASLFVVRLNGIRSMAVGAIVVVAIAVVATVTLLPALLALAGRRIDRLRVPFFDGRGGDGEAFWHAWSDRVMRHPVIALAAGVAFMLALASPVLAISTRNGALDQLPRDSEVRVATERLSRLAGPGTLGPMQVIVRGRAAADAVVARTRGLPGVAGVRPPVASTDGSLQLVEIVPSVQPESAAAHRLLDRVEAVTAAQEPVAYGGVTSFAKDVDRAVFGGLPKMILVILLFSYVVLLLLLRSVLLPLKAVLMNVLSVGAAYGVMVAVFQWGWFDWTGYSSPGYVDTISPVLLLAVTFGLSMDYEVFLLTRIRERYVAGSDNARAVAEGLAASARTITAAALIMVAVFVSFVLAGAPTIKELGLGLGVAIAVDATVVRLVLVPAAMRLLGEWNWWLPSPLARVLRRAESPEASPTPVT